MLTDLPSLVPLLQANLELNGEVAACTAQPLLWQQAETSWLSQGHDFSRVLMSDVLYHEPQYEPLLNVLQVVARFFRGTPPLKVLWAQEAHQPELLARMQRSLEEEGWAIQLITSVDDALGSEICLFELTTAPTTSAPARHAPPSVQKCRRRRSFSLVSRILRRRRVLLCHFLGRHLRISTRRRMWLRLHLLRRTLRKIVRRKWCILLGRCDARAHTR